MKRNAVQQQAHARNGPAAMQSETTTLTLGPAITGRGKGIDNNGETSGKIRIPQIRTAQNWFGKIDLEISDAAD
jgi:hypothetical protein